jgi:hypothetical protein
MKKYLKFLIILLAVAIVVPQITLAAWWNPVSWGMWGKIWSFFHKTNNLVCVKDSDCPQPKCAAGVKCIGSVGKCVNGKCTIESVVGGDKDEHGCIGSAGYSWCEAKQKCLRQWEEKCELVTYFQIKEFGIKFELPGDIKDLIYHVGSSYEYQTIGFSTNTLLQKDSSCNEAEGSIGTINISKKSPQDGPMNSDNLILVDNGSYFYYVHPQAVCTENKLIQDLLIKQTAFLQKALKTVVKIK